MSSDVPTCIARACYNYINLSLPSAIARLVTYYYIKYNYYSTTTTASYSRKRNISCQITKLKAQYYSVWHMQAERCQKIRQSSVFRVIITNCCQYINNSAFRTCTDVQPQIYDIHMYVKTVPFWFEIRQPQSISSNCAGK